MSGPPDSDDRAGQGIAGQGMLSKLPRTRPQRSSPRRAAARNAAARAGAGEPGTVTANGGRARARARSKPAGKTKAGKPARVKARQTREPIPRQGFECEGERAHAPVQPPGGPELVASAVEIVGELAKAGLSSGERLLNDVFSRLPLS
jgi:hypothetical protein